MLIILQMIAIEHAHVGTYGSDGSDRRPQTGESGPGCVCVCVCVWGGGGGGGRALDAPCAEGARGSPWVESRWLCSLSMTIRRQAPRTSQVVCVNTERCPIAVSSQTSDMFGV